ncbi:MFS transporter [Micromonospora sp. WMMD734]|uniref:MFS transporter n=1 Tax=unclassified Micromonospora TaxID=2617518 RepID=UPI002491AAAC|nr:MFS transporter [Micromonospora sp. AKA109]
MTAASTAASSMRVLVSRMLPPTGPQRALAGSVFAVTIGGGMMFSSSLYLTRIVGMSAGTVGVGLTVGAAVGLVAGPLAGHAADRLGPRAVHIATLLLGAVATAGFVLVRSFWSLVLVSLLVTLVGTAAAASRAPMVRALAGDRLTWFLSYQRAITNVGVMAGVLIASIAIQLDSGPVYVGLILLGASTFLVAAAVLTRVPYVAPLPPTDTKRRWVAFADRPYLAVTLINGGVSLHLAIPAFALPLWIADHTTLPRATITGFMLLNGILVVALQVRVSRGVVNPRAAAQRMVWAGVALLGSLAMMGAMPQVSLWPALALLVTATVVYTFGELWHAAASFELAFGLAQPYAQGQYAGAFGLGQGAANAASPAVLAATCLAHGLVGWLGLGVALLLLTLLTGPAVRFAERARPVVSSTPAPVAAPG